MGNLPPFIGIKGMENSWTPRVSAVYIGTYID